LIDWACANGHDRWFWAHPLDGGLAVSLSPGEDEGPYLVITPDDDWPSYDIDLHDHEGRPVVAWYCDGEEELAASMTEALERLAGLSAEHVGRQRYE
jgi:hypothetical protein